MATTISGFAMNEQGRDNEFGERSTAVRRAGAGVEAWRAALDAQQSAAPNHSDLYGLTREVTPTLAVIGQLMRVMSQQAAGYVDSLPIGVSVYEDERTDDPRELLAKAASVLDDIASKVVWAAIQMNLWWSLIGRIGVEETRPDDTGQVVP